MNDLRMKRTGNAKPINTPLYLARAGKCVIPGCGKKRAARGFCSAHSMRFRNSGLSHKAFIQGGGVNPNAKVRKGMMT